MVLIYADRVHCSVACRSEKRKSEAKMEKMDMGTLAWALASALFVFQFVGGGTQPLVPAVFMFGDSSVDVGNNDYLEATFRADYPPYGKDFTNHQATGRFCNGKLPTDFTGSS